MSKWSTTSSVMAIHHRPSWAYNFGARRSLEMSQAAGLEYKNVATYEKNRSIFFWETRNGWVGFYGCFHLLLKIGRMGWERRSMRLVLVSICICEHVNKWRCVALDCLEECDSHSYLGKRERWAGWDKCDYFGCSCAVQLRQEGG